MAQKEKFTVYWLCYVSWPKIPSKEVRPVRLETNLNWGNTRYVISSPQPSYSSTTTTKTITTKQKQVSNWFRMSTLPKKKSYSYKSYSYRYSHGEKMTTLKALGAGSTLGMKTIQLVEMSSIILTPIHTKLHMLKNLATKNMDILIRAYPGVIECKGSTTCISRRSVLQTAYRQCLDVYANLDWALSALCTVVKAHIPIEVMIINSREGHLMTDPAGYATAKFIPAGQYLDHKMGGSHLTYIQTANVLQRHQTRAKRHPALLAVGMAASVVSQIARLITTFKLKGEVSELTMNLKQWEPEWR